MFLHRKADLRFTRSRLVSLQRKAKHKWANGNVFPLIKIDYNVNIPWNQSSSLISLSSSSSSFCHHPHHPHCHLHRHHQHHHRLTVEASSEGDTGRVGRETVIGIEVVDVELTWKYRNDENDDDDDNGLAGMKQQYESHRDVSRGPSGRVCGGDQVVCRYNHWPHLEWS